MDMRLERQIGFDSSHSLWNVSMLTCNPLQKGLNVSILMHNHNGKYRFDTICVRPFFVAYRGNHPICKVRSQRKIKSDFRILGCKPHVHQKSHGIGLADIGTGYMNIVCKDSVADNFCVSAN